jgi:hypothetical protein
MKFFIFDFLEFRIGDSVKVKNEIGKDSSTIHVTLFKNDI